MTAYTQWQSIEAVAVFTRMAYFLQSIILLGIHRQAKCYGCIYKMAETKDCGCFYQEGLLLIKIFYWPTCEASVASVVVYPIANTGTR